MWIDTHVHLNDKKLLDRSDELVAEANDEGVGLMINASFNLESSRLGVELARRYDSVYTAVGLHPHEASDYTPEMAQEMAQLAQAPKVIAYGEVGLDYHYDNSPRELQQKVFIDQIDLANKLSLPVIIHNRDSHGDMLKILQQHPIDHGAIMHCFSGSVEYMQDCVKLGLMISFAGPITFKNARRLREVVRETPIDHLFVETDCPYLTPEPFRGRVNEPKHVVHVARKVAELKEMPTEVLEQRLEENVRRFFPNL